MVKQSKTGNIKKKLTKQDAQRLAEAKSRKEEHCKVGIAHFIKEQFFYLSSKDYLLLIN